MRAEVHAPISDPSWFDHQARQYPATGEPGIGYFKAALDAEHDVDTLLWRDRAGVVRGILNHYPIAIPPYEEAGHVNVMVDAAWRRQGIGTALLREAMTRWPIDLNRQRYTPKGRRLVKRWQQQHGGHHAKA